MRALLTDICLKLLSSFLYLGPPSDFVFLPLQHTLTSSSKHHPPSTVSASAPHNDGITSISHQAAQKSTWRMAVEAALR